MLQMIRRLVERFQERLSTERQYVTQVEDSGSNPYCIR